MWVVYIIRLSDQSLYTGITNDFNSRIKKHKSGKGSKYVRSRLPILEVHHIEKFNTKSEALKRELQIKKMSKKQKENLKTDC